MPTTPKDGLITFGAIYLLLTLVGNLSTHLWLSGPPQWMWYLIGPACLALFAALVALYALCTRPGRRTGWRAFLLCGTLLPACIWLLAIVGYALPLSYEADLVYETLIAGFAVKIEVPYGEAPFGVVELLWMPTIVLAVIVAPTLRAMWRKAADR